MIFTYEVNLLVRDFPNSHRITTAQQLHVDNIFKDKVNVLHVATVHGFPDTMICNIVFLVDGQDFLSLEVLALHLIKQECVRAGFDVVQYVSGETERPSLFRYLEMAVEEKVVPMLEVI